MDVKEELNFLRKFKIKFFWGEVGVGLWGGVRVDVNEELKFLRKIKKNKKIVGGGGGVGLEGVRVDVKLN